MPLRYFYFGIMFHRTGSFTAANTELRAKALRALYGSKGNLVKDALSHSAPNILFDFLIKSCLAFLGIPSSKSFSPNTTSPLIFLKI